MPIDQKRELRNYENRRGGESKGGESEAIGGKRRQLKSKRAFVRSLIKRGWGSDWEIAFLAEVKESFVRRQRRLLSQIN